MTEPVHLFEYVLGDPKVDAAQVETFVRDTMGQLANPGSVVAKLAAEEGVDFTPLLQDAETALVVVPDDGLTGAEIALAITTIAQNPTVQKVAKDLWEKVVLPLLQHHLGVDAIKRRPDPKGDSKPGKK